MVGPEGSAMGQWWLDAIGKALDEGSTFERVGSRKLVALLIAIWVRKTLRKHVGDLDIGAVACGLGHAIVNKSPVTADFDHIYRTMTFTRSSNLLNNAAVGVSSAAQMLRGTNAAAINPDEGKPDLSEADMVVFYGDFNYRLFGITYDEARDFVSQRSFDWLRERSIKSRNESWMTRYDSGEKKRIPAWCDRVLYRDNRTSPTAECSLGCPVVASIIQSVRRQEFGKIFQNNDRIRSILDELCYIPETDVSINQIALQNQDTFSLKISNRSREDRVLFQITCSGQSTTKEDGQASEYRSRGTTKTSLFSHSGTVLPLLESHMILLSFNIYFFGTENGSLLQAMPSTDSPIQVTPAAGIIKPDQAAEILVRHEDSQSIEDSVDGIPQSWWSEDTRDREVTLMINIKASQSTEAKTHQVHVRH
ncbi:hypothetical protein RND71_036987 [Anisodus tanguticus]|uniref:Inositol polyphosphate-related phosphatase domain-containing protein n=1 Tax=Anisodus tanguticus TaxID=243964 RepID=A0AAE1R2W2_9SOLA|nr:hypothetical protein RND71_036987 [Anisodus tanguticus]